MIITRTPLRVSLFGGGTDYPAYFHHNNGAILGGTIDKYVYVCVNDLATIATESFRIQYKITQSVDSISEIEHPVVQAVLNYFEWSKKLNISTVSDLPGSTGLGSSSSFTVGLLKALFVKKHVSIDNLDLAKLAIEVEQKYLGEKVGVQDQLHATFGGFSRYNFFQDSISKGVHNIKSDRINILNKSSVLIYTGELRAASSVLVQQNARTENKINDQFLLRMYELVDEAQNILEKSSDIDFLKEIGGLLKESWSLKKNLSKNISNPNVEEIVKTGYSLGAYGAKLLGAGNHGFVYFVGESLSIEKIKNHFGNKYSVDFKFQNSGTEVLQF